MYRTSSILLVGDFSQERVDIPFVCDQFGWKVETIACPDQIGLLPDPSSITAALIDLSAEGISALLKTSEQLPWALQIACCCFRQKCDWSQLEAAGAYHMLYKPLRLTELRQSLGFVQSYLESRRRRVVEIARDTGIRSHAGAARAVVG